MGEFQQILEDLPVSQMGEFQQILDSFYNTDSPLTVTNIAKLAMIIPYGTRQIVQLASFCHRLSFKC